MEMTASGLVFDTRSAPVNERTASATSVLLTSDGTLLVTMRLGTDREGPDGHTAILASDDHGDRWRIRYMGLGDRDWDGVRGETRGWMLAELEPGVLTASVLYVDRSDPGRPWVNQRTQGLLPMRIYQLTSRDGGWTWSDRRRIDLAPHPGASPTGPVLRLSDGALAQPFEHWKEYDDESPGRPKALLRVSRDGGQTWTQDIVVARDPGNALFYWDQRLATHPSTGEVVAMFWTHEPGVGRDRDIHISWAGADGRGWAEPVPTGLPGQHCQPIPIGGDRLVAAYSHRGDPPGIRAALSEDFGRTWDRSTEVTLYASDAGREPGAGGPRAQADFWNDMGAWQFGHPRGVLLPTGEVFAVFYGGAGDTRPAAGRESRSPDVGFDVLIRGGVVHDGLGSKARRADVGVTRERITAIASDLPADGASVVEAGGMAVAPGFVDLHTHSDVSLLSEPSCISAIEQGCTTSVVGLCGFSAGPMTTEGLVGLVDEEPVFAFPGVAWTWSSVGGYLDAVRQARPAMNVATFVGHNTLRRVVMGVSNRPPTVEELARMRRLLEEAFDDGARAFTTGLSYAPGLFADPDELVALAGVAARRGKPYHTHMRYGDDGVRASVTEALETARRSGAEINISHMYPRAHEPPEEADHLIGMVEASRSEGVEATWDITIFRRGGGAWVQTLPAWARDGGMAETQARIRDASTRGRLIALLEGDELEPWARDWDDQLIVKVSSQENAHLAGRSIGEIARERGRSGPETALDLVLEDGQYWVAPHIKRQEHLDRLVSHPLGVPIGDGFAAHPVRHASLGLMPKSFGTFPYLLGYYVRERGVLDLPTAIQKITSVPADRAGLPDRGRLVEGAAADLVVFDPATVANLATEADPGARPRGIDRVMVNGRWVVVDGAASGERPGVAL